MNRELSDFEKNTKLLAEQENPYDKDCPNRHLYNEGFVRGFEMFKEIQEKLVATITQNTEVK